MSATLRLIVACVVTLLAACDPYTTPSGPALSPSGRAPVADGDMCGGIAGFSCQTGLYCQMEVGHCRSTADASGVCARPAEICTREYRPVCGCDGKTYGNLCTAAAAGVSVAREGEC